MWTGEEGSEQIATVSVGNAIFLGKMYFVYFLPNDDAV